MGRGTAPSSNALPFLRWKEIQQAIAQQIKSLGGDRELRILEAGCGRNWSIDLGDTRYRLTGVDRDRAALESRQRDFHDLNEAVVGDLHDVHFEPGSFDVIYSAFVLEHVEGAERLLQKFTQWLRPNGLMILTVPDRNSVYGFFTRVTPFWMHVLYHRHLAPHGQRSAMAGTPGFGPYPTFHERVIARSEFRQFAAENDLVLKEEYAFWRLPRFQQKFAETVSALTFRALDGSHANLCYIAQRRVLN